MNSFLFFHFFFSTSLHHQITVYVQVVFLKIGEIDTVKENFAADVFVQARWREPKLDDDPRVSRWIYNT